VKVLLVGNPNVGKSVVFGLLTGRYVVVSNYPGTTVEISRGNARLAGDTCEVLDTPGANSLIPHSEDERVARDLVMGEPNAVVVQVADAKNLSRTLALTAQLAAMGKPMVLALNMWDEARTRGIQIDTGDLGARLGIPVVTMVATERRGLDRLRAAIGRARPADLEAVHGDRIGEALDEIRATLPAVHARAFIAEAYLAGDPSAEKEVRGMCGDADLTRLQHLRMDCRLHSAEPLSYTLTRDRTDTADEIAAAFVRRPAAQPHGGWAERLGRITIHPFWAWPILLAVLYVMYLFIGQLGAGITVDFLESSVFGTPGERVSDGWGGLVWYVAAAAHRIFGTPGDTGWGALAWALFFDEEAGLLTVGIRYAVAIVLPIVAYFFFFFGLLEDSGYLPRLAATADRFFKRMGLSGKAALPMVLGLGCGTMAVLTTRILETRKQRLIAIVLLTLGVPCSAQLGITAAVLTKVSILAVFIYIGIVLSQVFLVGALANRILPGAPADFLLEVPPMRMPALRNVLAKTGYRLLWYLKEAVPLFLIGTLTLFVARRLGLLDVMEHALEPVVSGLLGLPRQAAQGFLAGFLRRDYGAVMVFDLFKTGDMGANQALVALTVITLFVPCLAQFLIIVKEQRVRRALAIVGFVIVYAIAVGALLNGVLKVTGLDLSI
jgi:ferrous iron transport protein B